MSEMAKEALISALGLSLAHSLWQGTALGLLGVWSGRRLKNTDPEARYQVFCLLLLTLFIVWLGSFAVLYGIERESAAMAITDYRALGRLSVHGMRLSLPTEPLNMRSLRSLAPLLVLLWAAGICLLSLRHLCGFLALQHLRGSASRSCPAEWQERTRSLAARLGIRRSVMVRLCRQIDVPLTFGIVKSCILLPPGVLLGLPPAQLEALIAHELAHIRHNDALVNLLQLCVETVLFYHPAVWWLSAQIRVAREQRSDDLAIHVIGDPVLYARALYSMEELRLPIPHLALGAKGENTHMKSNHLIHRIHRVLGLQGREQRDAAARGVMALGTALLALATMGPVLALPAGDGATFGAHKGQTNIIRVKVTRNRQNTNGKIVDSTQITIEMPDKKVQLDTKTPTSETPVTVDGKAMHFGEMSADDQKKILHALKHVNVIHGNPEGTTHKTRIVIQHNSKKFELNTTDLKPETPVTVDGKAMHFGDLSVDDQKILRDALDHNTHEIN